MKLPRRNFLHLAAGAAALPAASCFAWAQAYPTRPVRIIVSTAAGSTTDLHGRLHGQWLSERLGQPFVVENRSGGATTLGAAEAIRSRPDGYTLLLLGISHAGDVGCRVHRLRQSKPGKGQYGVGRHW